MIKLLKNFRVIDWFLCVLIVGLTVGQAYLEIETIKYMGNIIELIQKYASGLGPLTSGMLWGIGWKMLLCSLGAIVSVIFINFCATYISSNFGKNLRTKVFKKVNSFSMEEMNKFSTASLITRSSNDIKQVEMTTFMILKMAVLAPIMSIFAVKEIIGGSIELTWATIIALGIMLLLVLFMMFVAIPKFGRIQKQTDKINALTRENLDGLRVVRAYNAEKEEQNKFQNANKELTKTNLFVNRVTSILMPGMSLIMNGLCLAIYWVGAYLINDGVLGQMTGYKTLATFQQYAMMVLISFMLISILFIMIPRGIVCARRIQGVLTTKTKIHDGINAEQKNGVGEVEFKNVCFAYPDAEASILENISFKVNKGETIAFIGSTGSGKSTLINLLNRFFDVSSGEILIDGKNVKDYDLESLNNIIGYVPQKGYLFSGTIKSNLQNGKKDATDEEMWEALSIAQADFVNELDEKLEYKISQGGTNVSGGQRQRLCIARAVIKKPELYIFDDSFSALDYKTDKKLRKQLKSCTKDATKFIVAQRIGTIIDADKIVVLEEGKMVGYGTHNELLKSCEVYKEIALSQLSKEEL